MKRVVIVGAGGHGREVAEILRSDRRAESVLGFVDEAVSLQEKIVGGIPVLGNWSWFDNADRSNLEVICAVGLPDIRRRLVMRATAMGLTFASAISSAAYISPRAKLGEGVVIFPNAYVSTECLIGNHSIINAGATISHDAKLDHYATINPGAHIAGNASIGEGCYLGIGCSVIHQVSIGAWSIIGAGAAVTNNIPENVTAVGVPARVISNRQKGWHERITSAAGK